MGEKNSPTVVAPALLARAEATLRLESEAIAALIPRLDADFLGLVDAVHGANGRFVLAGIGKSAHICTKLVATLNSTGTPALFLHAAEYLHGDHGLVQAGDIVLMVSNSGESAEIRALVPLVLSYGFPLAAMVGNRDSYLARHARWVLDASVEREACPHNLAPTASTAAQLALGDALAMCLMEARGFSSEAFAAYHPGGALGKRLYTRLGDLLDARRMPAVSPDAPFHDVLLSITSGRTGATAVLDHHQIAGIVTDGDIRRALERNAPGTAAAMMGKSPEVMDADELAVEAFHRMEARSISQVLVTRAGAYAGMVHLHDLLREGIF